MPKRGMMRRFLERLAESPFDGTLPERVDFETSSSASSASSAPLVATRSKSSAKRSHTLPRSFLQHFTLNPFEDTGLEHLPAEAEDVKPTRINFRHWRDIKVTSTQVGVTSAAWFAATVATLGLSQGGIPALLKSIRENPSLYVRGGVWTIPYTAVMAGLATKAQKAVQGDDHSARGVIKGVATGVMTETFIGNLFDSKSLQDAFLITKIKANPQSFDALTLEQLQTLLPKSAATSRGELLKEAREYPDRIIFNGRNIAMMSKATGIHLTTQDLIKVNSVMTLPAMLRNSYFYVVMAYANKAESEGTEMTPEQLATASVIGAAFTFIPNAITYGAADEVIKGRSDFDALRTAITNFKPGKMSPMQALAIFGVRALVMYTTNAILTPAGERKIGTVIDFMSGKTEAEIEKAEIEKEVAAIQADPEAITKAVRECQFAMDLIEAVATEKAEMEKTPSPTTEKQPSKPARKLSAEVAEEKKRGASAR